jgi:hypothetical protein
MKIQALLTAIAMNLKKLAAAMTLLFFSIIQCGAARNVVRQKTFRLTPERASSTAPGGLFSAPPHSLRTVLAMKNAESRGSM